MNCAEKFYAWEKYHKAIDEILFNIAKALHPTDFYTCVCKLYKSGDQVSEEDKYLMKLAKLLSQVLDFTAKHLQELDEQWDNIIRHSSERGL